MLKVIKCGCEFLIPTNAIVSIKSVYDGLLILLRDQTELRFNISVNPSINALINLVQTVKGKNIVLNIDNAVSGKMDSVLSIAESDVSTVTPVVTQTPQVAVVNEPAKPAPKKRGRPKKTA